MDNGRVWAGSGALATSCQCNRSVEPCLCFVYALLTACTYPSKYPSSRRSLPHTVPISSCLSHIRIRSCSSVLVRSFCAPYWTRSRSLPRHPRDSKWNGSSFPLYQLRRSPISSSNGGGIRFPMRDVCCSGVRWSDLEKFPKDKVNAFLKKTVYGAIVRARIRWIGF